MIRAPQKNDMMLLSLAMAKRNRELTDRLVNYMDERSEDLNRQLRHDADCWRDPKAFYKKELPYRMESAATMDLRHLTAMLSQGYTTNLTWLQNQLRNMGVKRFDITLTHYPLSTDDSTQEQLDLINIRLNSGLVSLHFLPLFVCPVLALPLSWEPWWWVLLLKNCYFHAVSNQENVSRMLSPI